MKDLDEPAVGVADEQEPIVLRDWQAMGRGMAAGNRDPIGVAHGPAA